MQPKGCSADSRSPATLVPPGYTGQGPEHGRPGVPSVAVGTWQLTRGRTGCHAERPASCADRGAGGGLPGAAGQGPGALARSPHPLVAWASWGHLCEVLVGRASAPEPAREGA